MAVTVTVRNVPIEVRNELASRAALKGYSLQKFLLQELVELSRRPDRRVLIAQLRANSSGQPSVSVSDILMARDSER